MALTLVACSLSGTRDNNAANAASDASIAFQQGRNHKALKAIHEALAARDDVSDYWLLLARISTASRDVAGAFAAYENVIVLDRANIEALRLLCQLGLSINALDKVDKYADQLLLLTPGDPLPLVMKGSAALQRGDASTAMRFADEVLATNSQDHDAQILKGRVLASRGKLAAAASYLEGVLADANDGPRLTFLMQLYQKAGDRQSYQRTVERLARVKPDDAEAQLVYADMLYQIGQPVAANTVIVAQMRKHPNDIGLAAKIVDVWLRQGPAALSPLQISEQAATASLEMKSAYARFANEVGRPRIAAAILGDVDGAEASVANSDAKAAQAYALGMQGQLAEAMRRLNDVIAFDPVHPGALLGRARLKRLQNDVTGAIADARQVVADDARNVTARLVLVDLFFARGDVDLGLATLREGVSAVPDDVRLAARLTNFLLANGQKREANDVLRNLVRASPTSLRASQLRTSLAPGEAKDPQASVSRTR
jgi:tetratricopeptide (TPR) repeat protein